MPDPAYNYDPRYYSAPNVPLQSSFGLSTPGGNYSGGFQMPSFQQFSGQPLPDFLSMIQGLKSKYAGEQAGYASSLLGQQLGESGRQFDVGTALTQDQTRYQRQQDEINRQLAQREYNDQLLAQSAARFSQERIAEMAGGSGATGMTGSPLKAPGWFLGNASAPGGRARFSGAGYGGFSYY